MKDFDEICKGFEKRPEDLEKDLYKTLQNIYSCVNVRALNVQYYYARIDFLFQNEFILRGKKDQVTPKGELALARGWVYLNIKEYKRQKRRELWEKITPHLLQAISIVVAIILGVLGLFFPRECSSESVSEIIDIIPHTKGSIIKTETQINEVSQASDNTEQEDCDENK